MRETAGSTAAVQGGGVAPPGPVPLMDREAFSAAFSGSARGLWCIAAAILHDKEAAHDVVQEAAGVALTKLGEFDPRTSFLAWAGQIVRFLALNERRRRQRSQERVELVEGAARAPQSSGVEERLKRELGQAVNGLEDTARACLLMRVVADMGYKDIAAALGIPEGTAMSHVHRSRLALRKQLAPHWVGGEEME